MEGDGGVTTAESVFAEVVPPTLLGPPPSRHGALDPLRTVGLKKVGAGPGHRRWASGKYGPTKDEYEAEERRKAEYEAEAARLQREISMAQALLAE